MKEKQRHRLLVEVIFSKPLKMRKARKGLQLVLDRSIDSSPVWPTEDSPSITKLTVTEVK